MRTEIDLNESEIDLNEPEIDLNESETDLNESEIDLNESEIDLNECKHFLKANLHRSEIHPTWINLSVNGSYYTQGCIIWRTAGPLVPENF